MSDEPHRLQPSTTEAVTAQSQSREMSPPWSPYDGAPYTHLDHTFVLGETIRTIFETYPDTLPFDIYEHQLDDPVYRPLRIFTLDPATSRLEGATALVSVPYEPLNQGPEGKLFKIEDQKNCHEGRCTPADLEDRKVLIKNGYDPSSSDFRFHRQMVYAVCSNVYATFRAALGRDLGLGSCWHAGHGKLVIRPHAFAGKNAYYDAASHQLHFGYYEAGEEVTGRTLPGSRIYACLSHDIITHELTHALLHNLRRHFIEPSGPDTLALHEAFADLVAIFQHFSYKEVVLAAMRKWRGSLEQAALLTNLAQQFGHTEAGAAIRTAIDVTSETDTPAFYDPSLEPHKLGSVLVSAVFEAFITVFKRKTARYIRLATHGTGVLPKEGELPADLQTILAEKASRLASQFLSVCIRAIDYCPPVDVRFGEYLRALITADYNLVPDDPWAYREALIDAFRRRRIHPRDVTSYAEEDLLWQPTRKPLPYIAPLSFAELKFQGDPGRPFSGTELRRQACVLGDFVTQREHLTEFGLVAEDDPEIEEAGDQVEPPVVESIRSARRIGPNGQIVFDIVAEIVQTRSVRGGNGREAFDYYGGCTVILGPNGAVRYVISKSVTGKDRLERRQAFLQSEAGQHYWQKVNGKFKPERAALFKLLDGVDV
jgi:hypothetical protein